LAWKSEVPVLNQASRYDDVRGRSELYLHALLISAQDGNVQLGSRYGRFNPGEKVPSND